MSTWRKSKKKYCPFRTGKLDMNEVHYANFRFLRKYVSETGKIVPSRITGVSKKHQSDLAVQIKYARYLALIPYCDRHN